MDETPRTTSRELIVVEDVAAAAERLFLELRPRTVALSGGSTPRLLYERLALAVYEWETTDIFFGDERCVPPEHPASNYRMAHEALLSRVPARVHRMPGETCDAEKYETELVSVFGAGVPDFDLVLLGLGEDGHTVSLFPGDAALEVRDRNVVRVQRPDYARLSLTLPVLNAARLALFLVAGEAKRRPLGQLMEGANIPAARVSSGRVTVLADQDAAGR